MLNICLKITCQQFHILNVIIKKMKIKETNVPPKDIPKDDKH